MNNLIFLSSLLSVSFCFQVFDKDINSRCSSEFTGDDGICLEAKDCAVFQKSRNQLKICSFNGRIPIVCCTKQPNFNDEKQKRISAQSNV